MRAPRTFRLASVLLALALAGTARPESGDVDHLRLVTYGPRASTREGDDDFVQVVLLEVPADAPGPIRVRLFDPDAGGRLDVFFGWGDFDTKTRFSLYGGAGATTGPGLRGARPTPEEVHSGEKLAERTFAIDESADGSWVTLAEVRPDQGEAVGDRRVFKLAVEGVAGNDGNVFDVDAVDGEGAAIPGLRMLSYVPTIHHETRSRTAEIRILPSGRRELTVHSFDAAGADLRIETRYRTIRADTSGQNAWSESTIELSDEEQGQVIALDFGGDAGEIPNDATLYIADEDGVVMPIQLPIALIVPNRRPKVKVEVRPVDCERAELDATGTTDAEGHRLRWEWAFDDGEKAEGSSVTHRFVPPGAHEARLRVTDDSGQVGAGTEVVVPFTMNAPPTSDGGADRTVAPGEPISFDGGGSRDSDGRITRFGWDFGDGATATGRSVRHGWKQPGRYTVKLEVADDSAGPCATATDEVSVWVNQEPTAVPSASDRAAVGEAVTFDARESRDVDGTLTRWDWDFGDGAGASGETAEHAYDAPGTWVVRLTVADDAGVGNSSTSATHRVVVNDPPVARAGEDREVAIAEPFELDGSASLDPDGSIVDYQWTFGDGGEATGAKVSHRYAAAGRYEVRLRVRDDSRTSSDTREDVLEVVVNAPPVAEAGPDQRVTRSEVRFDASESSDSDGKIVSYEWDFGDGTTGRGTPATHVYSGPGTYVVGLRVTDDSPTPRNTAEDGLRVVINARPVADAGADRLVAVGQRVSFDATGSSDPDGEIVSYRWEFGDGDRAEGPSVAHVFRDPGTYTVHLEVADDTGHEAATDDDDLRVVVNAAPVARLPASPRVGPGDVVSFDAGASFDAEGEIASFSWTVDGEPAGDGPTLERTFPSPGVHEVSLRVDDGSGAANSSSRVATTVHVNARPIARAGPDRVSCEPTLSFDGSGSADPDGDPLAFEWDFGDGGPVARGPRVTHVFADGGSYPVTLRVDDGSGLANASHLDALEVRVNRPPRAVAGEDRTQCAGEIVLFDGSESSDPDGDALKYVWDFGDGSSATGPHPVHVFEQAGAFPITLTVQDDSGLPCGVHHDRRVIRVAAAPVAEAGPDVDVCANVDVTFDGSASRDADGTVDRYTWDFGDGARGNGPRPSHRYARAGTYRVVLSVEGAQVADCDNLDTDEMIVTVRSAPTASIEGPSALAPGEKAAFHASGAEGADGESGATWRWEFGDGDTAEGAAVEHAWATPGGYDVVLTATASAAGDCGEMRRTKRVHVNAPPKPVLAAEDIAAPGQTIAFSAADSEDSDGVIESYHWSFGDGREAEGVEVFHRFEEPGRYDVRLAAVDESDASNRRAEAHRTVVVNAPPRARVEIPGVACPGQEIGFDASASSDEDGEAELSYLWDFGDGSGATGATARHAYGAPGIYPVSVLLDDRSGAANAKVRRTRELRVNRPPEARGGPDRVVCAGESVTFDGSASRDLDGAIVAYRWDFGTEDASTPVASHVFPVPGAERVELSVTDDSESSCATTVAPVRVRVNVPPVADAGGDRTGFAGGAHDALRFDGRGSIDSDGDPLTFAWTFGDGTEAEGPVVAHAYDRPGTYRVRLRVRDGTGSSCGESVSEATVTIGERERP